MTSAMPQSSDEVKTCCDPKAQILDIVRDFVDITVHVFRLLLGEGYIERDRERESQQSGEEKGEVGGDAGGRGCLRGVTR